MMKDLDNDAVPSDRECRPILNIKDDYRRIMVLSGWEWSPENDDRPMSQVHLAIGNVPRVGCAGLPGGTFRSFWKSGLSLSLGKVRCWYAAGT